MKLSINLLVIFAEIYNTLVVTSDKVGAGTDANVYIIIYGENGDTGKNIKKLMVAILTSYFKLHSKSY